MSSRDLSLSWKFLDSFPVGGDIDCIGGAFKISSSKFNLFGKVARQVSCEWKEKFKAKFGLNESSRIRIGFGTYGSAFFVPIVFKIFSKVKPNCSVFSFNVPTEVMKGLSNQISQFNLDILIGVDSGEEDNFGSIKFFRKYYDDQGLLAAEKSQVESFGQNFVLKHGDLLFGRLMTGSREESYNFGGFYSTIPDGRSGDAPKVISDFYFMNHLLMKRGVGIWHVFKNSFEPDSIAILDNKPISTIRRRVVYSTTVSKSFNQVLRIFLNVVSGGQK